MFALLQDFKKYHFPNIFIAFINFYMLQYVDIPIILGIFILPVEVKIVPTLYLIEFS